MTPTSLASGKPTPPFGCAVVDTVLGCLVAQLKQAEHQTRQARSRLISNLSFGQ